eukprot:6487581-Pyramimonas_sp.AAC.1
MEPAFRILGQVEIPDSPPSDSSDCGDDDDGNRTSPGGVTGEPLNQIEPLRTSWAPNHKEAGLLRALLGGGIWTPARLAA